MARSDALPDVPTVAEFLPGYEASAWWGIVAPKNTPAEIIKTLNTQVNASLADANFQARLANPAQQCSRSRPASSASSSPTKPKSGARSSGLLTSRRTEADPLSIFHNSR